MRLTGQLPLRVAVPLAYPLPLAVAVAVRCRCAVAVGARAPLPLALVPLAAWPRALPLLAGAFNSRASSSCTAWRQATKAFFTF